MDIGDIVKACKILLLDIEGTTSSISFVKDKLFPYVEKNVKAYLETQWERDDVKEVVAALRQLALKDAEDKVEGLVEIPPEDASKEDQIEGLVNNVKWQMSCDRKTGALKLLQGLVLKQGYDCGDIKGHVYEDVMPSLKQWRWKQERKVYIYSSGSVAAQKMLFGQSCSGDLLVHIDGHFDTSVGGKQEASSYTAIAQKIGVKPEEILFLTDIVQEAEAARAAGLQAALVLRDMTCDPAPRCPCPLLPYWPHPHVHSLAQLAPTNKRKPDTQEEELPSKVAKTLTEDDVKTKVVELAEKKPSDKTVTMEIDEAESANVDNGVDLKENGKEDKPASEETVNIEDVTSSSEGLPASDVVPIVEETVEVMEEDIPKSDEKEFTKNGKCETIPEVENETEPASEEASAGTKIVEIEDKESPNNTDEVTENSEPVIDEPDSADAEMAELHNVAEVLGKECTDLLSKVNDVTNLDNISVKMLTPVVEENISNENGDSNDIVDSILESEIELELKQKQDMDNKKAEEEAADKEKLDDKEKPVAKTDLVDKVNEATETSDKCIDVTKHPENDKVVEPKPLEETITTENNEAEKTSSPEDQIKVEADKETDNKAKDDKVDSTSNENSEPKIKPQVNGKSNGDTAEVVNGVAGKDEELHARLSVENGSAKETANGSEEKDVVQGNGEEKAANLDVADIKVKTVTETHSETIDQSTEA